jgi:cystathionine beta-lyase
MPLFSNVNISNKSWKPVGDYGYSRSANPTRTALEEALASIENGARGLAFHRDPLLIA